MADNALVPSQTARYWKPKILTLDLPTSLTERLRVAGYNVTNGTLGRPYKVQKQDGYMPVIPKAYAPDFAEQEVPEGIRAILADRFIEV